MFSPKYPRISATQNNEKCCRIAKSYPALKPSLTICCLCDNHTLILIHYKTCNTYKFCQKYKRTSPSDYEENLMDCAS